MMKPQLANLCFAVCDPAAGITVRGMPRMNLSLFVCALLAVAPVVALGQSPSERNPDVSNKALITKSTPGISTDAFKSQSANATEAVRKMADEYYAWRNENY